VATIQVDEQTAAAIASRAASQGLSVAELLRQWVAEKPMRAPKALSTDEFDQMLDKLSGQAPPLPSDFSRADIYCDHD
jgi:hypothetical protein